MICPACARSFDVGDVCPHCGASVVPTVRPAVVKAAFVLYLACAVVSLLALLLGAYAAAVVARVLPGGMTVGLIVALGALACVVVSVWGAVLVARQASKARVAAVALVAIVAIVAIINILWLGASSLVALCGIVLPVVILILLSAPKATAYLTKSTATIHGGWASPPVYLVSLFFILVMIVPVFYIVISGFRSNSQLATAPEAWPNPWSLNEYVYILTQSLFWPQALNSVICAVATTVGAVVLGVMVSFVLARYNFTGSGAMYTLFAAGLMFPMTVAITPLYLLIKNLGLINNLAGIILPQIAFALPTTVIILVPFLRAIPMEIEEASTVDGCSRLGFFWRMVIPLSMPGVVTVGILAFIGSWNAYMLPLYVMSDQSRYTLPLGTAMFSTAYAADMAGVMAFVSLSMIPALVFFLVFQKRIVGGLTGAVKG